MLICWRSQRKRGQSDNSGFEGGGANAEPQIYVACAPLGHLDEAAVGIHFRGGAHRPRRGEVRCLLVCLIAKLNAQVVDNVSGPGFGF